MSLPSDQAYLGRNLPVAMVMTKLNANIVQKYAELNSIKVCICAEAAKYPHTL